MSNSASNKHELANWFWLWLIPLPLIAQLIVRAISKDFAVEYFSGEGGIIENFTVIVLIPAIVISVYIVTNRSKLPNDRLAIWYSVLGLACLYFAGEEASWGQHWFGWQTPAVMGELNDQGETNLHNMSSWLDQKPRLIVEISALIGGVIWPLWRRWKGIIYQPGTWQYYFWPTGVCLPVCLIVGLIKIPDRIIGAANIPYPFNLNVSETQELFVALAFLVYLMSVAVRLRSGQAQINT